jgi:muramidase (phage lysozyme)
MSNLSIQSKYYKSFLDLISYTEGTLGVSKNGYDVLFNNYTIVGWDNTFNIGHQGEKWYDKGKDASPAGRYQFVTTTWCGLSEKYKNDLSLEKLKTPFTFFNKKFDYNAPFNKINQDYLAFKLLSSVITESELKDMSKSLTDFEKILTNKNELLKQWVSLKVLPIKNKQICKPNGCSSYYEELYNVYKLALSKY